MTSAQLVRQLLEHAVHLLQAEAPSDSPWASLDRAQLVLEDSLERPRQADHGDWSVTLAMRLAKPLRLQPRQIGQSLLEALQRADASTGLIDRAELAGPGFINLHLTTLARTTVLEQILASGHQFGRRPSGSAPAVLLEFVSANPTGPLHVGHGRQAALGDVLAEVLTSQGFTVTREFYYNDAGAQIDNLARSVQARALGITPESPEFPADGYRGHYIAELAEAFLARATLKARDGEPVTASGDPDDLEEVRRFAVAALRHEQDLDLQAFGLKFDVFSLESALYQDGHVASVVSRLVESGHAYEAEGALWLRTTDYGDDKDRVMRKADGGTTYFVPDLAYHEQKWKRGFTQAINIQGSDHHGTIARVRAGLQALNIGIPQGYPDYILHKMVTVMKGGQEVKLSKRAGSYVTLRDLILWSGGADPEAERASLDQPGVDLARGRDAVRFFLVSRKADTEFVFDLDLALAQSDENPVFYVQYAHARLASIFRQLGCEDLAGRVQQLQALSPTQREERRRLLVEPQAAALCARLEAYPDLLAQAAQDRAPHLLAFYLRDLAADIHSFYNALRVGVEEAPLREARLWLATMAQITLQAGLGIMGLQAPEQMTRAADPTQDPEATA